MPDNRDRERRLLSKKAYYERHKARLQEQARQRATARRQNEDGREAHRKESSSYRHRHWEKLRIRRLNEYRKAYIQEHGIDSFKEDFKGRIKLPLGKLLEHYSETELVVLLGNALPPTFADT